MHIFKLHACNLAIARVQFVGGRCALNSQAFVVTEMLTAISVLEVPLCD